VDLSEFSFAAGPPTAVQPIEDAPARQDGDYFAHRVEGDSMRDAGIREGDIVVATIPNEVTGEPRATVNRLPRSGRTRLLPENPAYEPIENDEITIIGQSDGALACSCLTVALTFFRS
jgi:repressor LexA